MKSLVIVYTPYQLISMINTMATRNECDFDVLIAHKNIEKYISICKMVTAGDVFVCPELYDGPINHGSFISHAILVKRIISKKKVVKNINGLCSSEYDNLFVPSDDTTCRVVYSYLKKKKSKLKLNLYDDGVGTYSGIVFKKKKMLNQIMLMILLQTRFYEVLDEIYCYHPQLVNSNRNIKITKIIVSKKINEIMDEIIQGKEKVYFGKKVVFLDQGITNIPSIKDGLDMFSKYFSKEEVIIKRHPRVKNQIIFSDYIMSDDGLPSEALVTSLNCSKCIFVSYSSTGCISPLLINGEKPYVIMLNRLCSCDTSSMKDVNFKGSNLTQVENFFDKINEFAGFEYIKRPETVNDLEAYLEEIAEYVEPISRKDA